MKTSHPSPKGNFFIKIHLSCNFSVHKYALAFFFFHETSPSPFTYLKEKLQQGVLQAHYLAQLFARC